MNKFFFLLLLPILSFSQSFKEAIEFYPDGAVFLEVTKNVDLEITKKTYYTQNGEVVLSEKFDPETGLRNGEFTQGKYTGSYNQGVLNCDKCIAKVKPQDFDHKNFMLGKFTNGKPVGKIESFRFERNSKPYNQKLRDVVKEIGDLYVRLIYDWSFNGSYYTYINNVELNYNSLGALDGYQHINTFQSLVYVNGVLQGIFSLNEKNRTMIKDSVWRSSKIWKIDNKYTRNQGFLKDFYWNPFDRPNKYSINGQLDENDRYRSNWKFFGEFGAVDLEDEDYRPSLAIENYKSGGVLSNGIFYKYGRKKEDPSVTSWITKNEILSAGNPETQGYQLIRYPEYKYWKEKGFDLQELTNSGNGETEGWYLMSDMIIFDFINQINDPNSTISDVWIKSDQYYKNEDAGLKKATYIPISRIFTKKIKDTISYSPYKSEAFLTDDGVTLKPFNESFKSTPGRIENIKDVELTSIMDYFSIDTYIKASKNNYPYSGTVDYNWQRDFGSGVGGGGDYGFIYYLMGKYICAIDCYEGQGVSLIDIDGQIVASYFGGQLNTNGAVNKGIVDWLDSIKDKLSPLQLEFLNKLKSI